MKNRLGLFVRAAVILLAMAVGAACMYFFMRAPRATPPESDGGERAWEARMTDFEALVESGQVAEAVLRAKERFTAGMPMSRHAERLAAYPSGPRGHLVEYTLLYEDDGHMTHRVLLFIDADNGRLVECWAESIPLLRR